MDLKLEVANVYQQSAALCGWGRPNFSQIAAKFMVDFKFVKKIEDEIWQHKRVLLPEEICASLGSWIKNSFLLRGFSYLWRKEASTVLARF